MASRIHPGSAAIRRADEPAAVPISRHDGLDALRAGTMLMVVAFHAALAYAPTPIPRLIWACRDPDSHPIMDLFCWWSLGISSPFFLMSGFFAAHLYATRGGGDFLLGRAKRIGVPLLVACVTILPATLCVWIVGWLATGQCTLREVIRLRFHGKGFQENLCGPGHLWSLEYLALMLLGFWGWKEITRRFQSPEKPDANRWERRLVSPWLPLGAAIPTAFILWAGHRHGGLDVILDRSNSFLPEPYRFLHYGAFFVAGAALFRARRHLEGWAAWGWTYLALSVPAFAARAWLIRAELVAPLTGSAALALAATAALFSWLLTFGLLGVALKPAFARRRPTIRYLADSSYWIYLAHLPIIGLAQIALLRIQAPAALKFAAVLATTMALGLATYHTFIRHTILGTWLHGRRDRSSVPECVRPAASGILAGRPCESVPMREASR
jgi:glucan biosynthesis protein C